MNGTHYLKNGSKSLLLSMLAMLLAIGSWAQSTISGVVRSEGDMETIPGVSVLVKGTTRGSVTDLDGRFEVNASPGEVLSVSYIGYTTKEVPVQSGLTSYDIVLVSSMGDLT